MTAKVWDDETDLRLMMSDHMFQEEQLRRVIAMYQEKRDALIPEEIKKQLREITIEQEDMVNRGMAVLKELEESIGAVIIKHGESFSIESEDKVHQVVYYKGKISWDTKGLDGFAVAVPAVKKFRKQGKPYVTFTTRDKKK